jgi:predicted cobalt transporter CbtA
MFACVVAGIVVEILGTPEPDVINTPEFAVANAAMTLALLAYKMVLAALVVGYVLVDHTGVVDAPESNS